MPPNKALEERPARERPARAGAHPQFYGEDSGRTRLTLVNAVQDAQRKRRKRTPLKRLTAIVPVSDYRDVVG